MLHRLFPSPRSRQLQCLLRPIPTPPSQQALPHKPRYFTTTPPLHDDSSPPDHYATLNLPPTATPSEIKKSFYQLSKTHHPDHNPNDPNASQRFVKISEAYAILGSTDKRARYDRDQARYAPTQGPTGSYSSSSGSPAGGRPASGLSRRRTQFKGPPPSFYRSGGWGTQGKKRGEYANRPSHEQEGASQEAGQEEGGSFRADAPGTGPGGFAQGFHNDVPHFDRAGHFRTQESVQKTISRKRAAVAEFEEGGTSVLLNFVLMSGVLGLILTISGVFDTSAVVKVDSKKKDKA